MQDYRLSLLTMMEGMYRIFYGIVGFGVGYFSSLHSASFQPVVGGMASLGASKVHARSGPGKEYPVIYTYSYGGLPVKVLDVFALWCQVQDHRHGGGWIHKSLLRRPRHSVVLAQTSVYDREHRHKVVGTIEKDVLVQCRTSEKSWCYIQPHQSTQGGWIGCQYLWGPDPL